MLIDKARSFIQTMYSELKYNTNEVENRMKEIEQEINLTGSYILMKNYLTVQKWHGETQIVVLVDCFGVL